MGWWVLKHRRHEGPFTEEALRHELRKGRFRAEDYALSGEDLDAGRFEYVPLARVLDLKAEVSAPQAEAPLVPAAESPDTGRATSSAESTAARIQASFSATPVNPAALAGFQAADFVPGSSKSSSRSKRKSSPTSGGVALTSAPSATGTAMSTDPTPVSAPATARKGLPRLVRVALAIAVLGALGWVAIDKFQKGGGDAGAEKRPASTSAPRPAIPTVVKKSSPRSGSNSGRSLRLPEVPESRENEPLASAPMVDNAALPQPDMLPPPQTEPAYNTGFAGLAGDPVPPPPPASEYDAPPAPPPPPAPEMMPGLPEPAE